MAVATTRPYVPFVASQRGEGRSSALLLVAGFLTISLGLIALGTRYFPGDLGNGVPLDPTASTRRTRTAEPGLTDLQWLDSRRSRVSATQGGVVEGSSGSCALTIPAGALQADTVVQLSRYRLEHPAAPSAEAIDLLPDGLTLTRPAELSMRLPLGIDATQVELAVFEPASRRWISEPTQHAGADGRQLIASISHFSLRRLRIRPGMSFPSALPEPRGVLRLESDENGFFEQFVKGRWQTIDRTAASYRELVSVGRAGRLDLIRSGRLRMLAGPDARAGRWSDDESLVALPPNHPAAHAETVVLQRLDSRGRPVGPVITAQVRGVGPNAAQQQLGIVAILSRHALEQLGLSSGSDFGVSAEHPELLYMRVPDAAGQVGPLPYVTLSITASTAPPASAVR